MREKTVHILIVLVTWLCVLVKITKLCNNKSKFYCMGILKINNINKIQPEIYLVNIPPDLPWRGYQVLSP